MAEVRPCPKCGWQNSSSNKSCANCFAPLVQAPQPPLQQTQQMPPASHQVPRSEPVRLGPNPMVAAVVLALVAIAAVGMALAIRSKANQPPPKPTVSADAVADKFLKAKQTRDLAKVKPYLTAESIRFLETRFSSKQARSAGFDQQTVANMYLFDTPPTSDEIKHSTVTIITPARIDEEKNQAIVEVKIEPPKGSLLGQTTLEQLVMVNEEGQWKVDLNRTAEQNDETGVEGIMRGLK